MKVLETPLEGLLLLEPRVFGDSRGYFFESYQRLRYQEVGVTQDFVQDNFSLSAAGVLRGLHFQLPRAQAKLVTVIRGRVLDVVVDLRLDSVSFGEHFAVELSGESKRQLLVPDGFAHAFLTLEDDTLFHYKCSDSYAPECEHTLLWNDPALGIDWPLEAPSLSEKDQQGMPLAELREKVLEPRRG